MAVFTVLNGTGVNGAGIQFGSFSQLGSSGVAGFPLITPTTGSVFFNDGGALSVTGSGMGFALPSSFSGTVNSLTYSKPGATPVFSLTGMNTPLADVAAIVTGGGDELAVLGAIFAGDDTIGGSTQADVLLGFNGNDVINGGDGNDHLFGGAGADALNGGSGFDYARYDTALSGGVIVSLDAGAGYAGDALGDVTANIEGVVGSLFADIIVGGAGDNTLFGSGGDDYLFGLGGVDVLYGDAGADQLYGGSSIDLLVGGADGDTFFTAASDVAANVFDYVFDFQDGLDVIVLQGWTPGSQFLFESGGHTFITSSAVGFGGVIVLNATLAQVQDQVVIF